MLEPLVNIDINKLKNLTNSFIYYNRCNICFLLYNIDMDYYCRYNNCPATFKKNFCYRCSTSSRPLFMLDYLE